MCSSKPKALLITGLRPEHKHRKTHLHLLLNALIQLNLVSLEYRLHSCPGAVSLNVYVHSIRRKQVFLCPCMYVREHVYVYVRVHVYVCETERSLNLTEEVSRRKFKERQTSEHPFSMTTHCVPFEGAVNRMGGWGRWRPQFLRKTWL